jgi:hypothetical protein
MGARWVPDRKINWQTDFLSWHNFAFDSDFESELLLVRQLLGFSLCVLLLLEDNGWSRGYFGSQEEAERPLLEVATKHGSEDVDIVCASARARVCVCVCVFVCMCVIVNCKVYSRAVTKSNKSGQQSKTRL